MEPRNIDKILRKIPVSVKEKYQVWKALVRYNGPGALKEFSGFHDEKLKGKRNKQRSSRLSLQYRLIYEADKINITVYIIEITPHEY